MPDTSDNSNNRPSSSHGDGAPKPDAGNEAAQEETKKRKFRGNDGDRRTMRGNDGDRRTMRGNDRDR